jgi:hypothetical protein
MNVSRRRLVASSLALLLAPACKKPEPKLPEACTDASGLKPDEAQVRTALGYVDRSPDPVKKCVDCQQYTPAEKDGACGGCKLFKGPVHPHGSCNAFGKKA